MKRKFSQLWCHIYPNLPFVFLISLIFIFSYCGRQPAQPRLSVKIRSSANSVRIGTKQVALQGPICGIPSSDIYGFIHIDAEDGEPEVNETFPISGAQASLRIKDPAFAMNDLISIPEVSFPILRGRSNVIIGISGVALNHPTNTGCNDDGNQVTPFQMVYKITGPVDEDEEVSLPLDVFTGINATASPNGYGYYYDFAPDGLVVKNADPIGLNPPNYLPLSSTEFMNSSFSMIEIFGFVNYSPVPSPFLDNYSSYLAIGVRESTVQHVGFPRLPFPDGASKVARSGSVYGAQNAFYRFGPLLVGKKYEVTFNQYHFSPAPQVFNMGTSNLDTRFPCAVSRYNCYFEPTTSPYPLASRGCEYDGSYHWDGQICDPE